MSRRVVRGRMATLQDLANQGASSPWMPSLSLLSPVFKFAIIPCLTVFTLEELVLNCSSTACWCGASVALVHCLPASGVCLLGDLVHDPSLHSVASNRPDGQCAPDWPLRALVWPILPCTTSNSSAASVSVPACWRRSRVANHPMRRVLLTAAPPTALCKLRSTCSVVAAGCSKISCTAPPTAPAALGHMSSAFVCGSCTCAVSNRAACGIETNWDCRHKHGGLKPHALNSITHSFTHSTST